MPTRVLHIITGLDLGGAERSLVNLLGATKGDDVEHVVLSLSDLGHYGPELQTMGFAVYALNLRTPRGLLIALVRLRKLITQISPNVIQGWMYHGNIIASLANFIMRSSLPIIWNIRQSLYDINSEKISTRVVIILLKLISYRAYCIIYNSNQSRDHHESFGFNKKNSLVISNGFDVSRWRPSRRRRKIFREEIGLSENDPVVGFVGRYHLQKDVPTFLRACAIAMNENPDLHVVIVGEGLTSANPALGSFIARLPSQRTHMLGARTDIETVFSGLDFFCLSSSSEAFPNVLGEAMACAVPSIVTNVGECAAMVPKADYVVAVGDYMTMAKKIVEFSNMKQECRNIIGQTLRRRIKIFYSLQSTIDAYEKLYLSTRSINAK